jgi:hypothetical protein
MRLAGRDDRRGDTVRRQDHRTAAGGRAAHPGGHLAVSVRAILPRSTIARRDEFAAELTTLLLGD